MTVGDSVVLTVPAHSEYARTVRLLTAEVASRAGLDVDGIDDARIAVEEAFVFAVGRAAARELTFRFTLDGSSIAIEVTPLIDETLAGDAAPERLSRYILESVCDSYELGEYNGAHGLRVVKSVV